MKLPPRLKDSSFVTGMQEPPCFRDVARKLRENHKANSHRRPRRVNFMLEVMIYRTRVIVSPKVDGISKQSLIDLDVRSESFRLGIIRLDSVLSLLHIHYSQLGPLPGKCRHCARGSNKYVFHLRPSDFLHPNRAAVGACRV